MAESVFGKDRTVVFSGEVDQESVGKLIMGIKATEEDDDSKEMSLVGFTRNPIKLNINTNGGSIYDALALIDVIESCRTPIFTFGYGQLASAGFPIFLAGKRRFCGKYATFMFHEASMGIKDYSSIIDCKAREVNRLENILNEIMKKDTKITDKMLKQWHNDREVYIDANTALKLGIVHEIL